ncbi:zf-DHHC-domain-containing protein [Basidiobolus meristosporus CBS 931.73]|uniref:Palmitoyltransferase n=1 Tax=Basidiobolus meristosporus CBS 931.73 TaxID=1314790 RepID=A0A1Y1YY67_9FUNG|nr:zf-DHHC-domain-containing protein [Basidiobolus meristosporus CBS 931.73]|eukprot:ORY02973.1 zf-DHHC-domain-containing protein [Basidiobolus meristosporus CBS 931.73]
MPWKSEAGNWKVTAPFPRLLLNLPAHSQNPEGTEDPAEYPSKIPHNPWQTQPALSEKNEFGEVSTCEAANLEDTASQGPPPSEATKNSPVASRTTVVSEYISSHISPNSRFCNICEVIKPSRCHHCSTCNRCILKMDQINQCVGWGNYKLFYLFILYTSLFCILVVASIIPPLVHRAKSGNTIDTQWGIILAVAAVAGSGTLLLTRYHTKLLLNNQTTIEDLQSTRSGGNNENIYDLGRENNWRAVMGNVWWLWFVPTSNSVGNGLHFPNNCTDDLGMMNNVSLFEPLEPVATQQQH